MRKLISIVMRSTNFGMRPDAAFNSDDEAFEYGKQKESEDKNYKFYVSQVYLEDKEQK